MEERRREMGLRGILVDLINAQCGAQGDANIEELSLDKAIAETKELVPKAGVLQRMISEWLNDEGDSRGLGERIVADIFKAFEGEK